MAKTPADEIEQACENLAESGFLEAVKITSEVDGCRYQNKIYRVKKT